MEKVTRSFKNLYHGIAIPNQIHSTVIALSDESERSQRSTPMDHSVALSDESELLASHSPMRMNDVLGQGRHGRLTLQTKDISETDGKCAMLVDAYKGVESLVSPRFSSRSPITPVTTTGVAT